MMFFCVGENVEYLNWYINGLHEKYKKIKDLGIDSEEYTIHDQKYSILTVPASAKNTNLSIQCSIQGKQNMDEPTDHFVNSRLYNFIIMWIVNGSIRFSSTSLRDHNIEFST